MEITSSRRQIQQEHNQKHGITPRTVRKEKVEDLLETFGGEIKGELDKKEEKVHHYTQKEVEKKIKELEAEMKKAAKELRFEDAAHLRDLLKHYQGLRLLEDNL